MIRNQILSHWAWGILVRLTLITLSSSCSVLTVLSTGTAVYSILEKINITVSGGRIDGVGVGGFLLGGGYSYLSSQVSVID